MKPNRIIIVLLVLLFASIHTYAIETRIIVRAKAKDAKFLGSSIGGAQVIIKDKLSGQILLQGKTAGTPGNTNMIMKAPKDRYTKIADDGAAKFEGSLDISEPIFVRIEVLAPMNHKQSQVSAATELWLLPGKHIIGDGVILEIPGFIVDALLPRTHQFIKLSTLDQSKLKVQANVVMMCGCLIDKGGVWNSDSMEVQVTVKRNGEVLRHETMQLISPNLFETTTTIPSPGEYEMIISAYDPNSGNTGVDKVNFVIM